MSELLHSPSELDVPRETYLQLERFVRLYREWGAAINLSSPREELWKRHVFDSRQLSYYCEQIEGDIVDLGSGGGFPGVVISILNPDRLVRLVESDRRKSLFLRHCKAELGLESLSVVNERIEAIKGLRPATVTARALAPLPRLFVLLENLLHPNLTCLFLKGKNYAIEIEEAQKQRRFDFQAFDNPSGEGVILKIKNIGRAK